MFQVRAEGRVRSAWGSQESAEPQVLRGAGFADIFSYDWLGSRKAKPRK